MRQSLRCSQSSHSGYESTKCVEELTSQRTNDELVGIPTAISNRAVGIIVMRVS